MEELKGKIGYVGGVMALAGVVSAGLSLFNYELRILLWIDQWGTGAGWGIRVGLIVVGIALWFLFSSGESGETEAEE